ncbi:MAG: response regulator transcription factor [Acidimicrobiales bacterium]
MPSTPLEGTVIGGPELFSPERGESERDGDAVRSGHRSRRSALTVRDLQVLGYLAEGWTTAEIARTLVYAESTIKKEVHMIVHRMGARNRTHAVALAVRGSMI